MQLVPLDRPVPGAEPAADVVNLVFLANLAAQEITGETASSTSVERVQNRLRGSVEYDTRAFSLVAPDEDPAGYLLLSTPLLEDTQVADVEVILDAAHLPLPGADFEPEARAVLDHLYSAAESLAHKLGRRLVQTWLLHPAAEEPGTGDWAHLLRSRGYELGLTEVQGVVTVGDAPTWPAGVTVEVVRDLQFPTALVPGVLELYHRASVDVPHGGMQADPVDWTPKRLRAAAERVRTTRREVVTVVLSDATGPIGISEITRFPGSEPGIAEQGITMISPTARGRGYGLELKKAALQAASAELGATRVYTSNAADNPWMIRINRHLGWQVISGGSGWQKVLDTRGQ
ncbi:GNAT family N-acetyltransferase [Corynebacterium sp.]|uniref:GNAT family N-acetyltransferase n=1 Tax=Corynebacterium sp. TaxID=1720 RepID=UPI0026E054BC|nr:GNAT family N-acetyltransferase [Corynebacterium sp.]MDO5511324.1 GNAT family N-acetyltransferase [Corynebacterium sp.]